jgi:hypothetical protein
VPVLERRDWRCTRRRSWRCKAKTKARAWLPYVRVEDRRQAYVHMKTGRRINQAPDVAAVRAHEDRRLSLKCSSSAPGRAREDPKPTCMHLCPARMRGCVQRSCKEGPRWHLHVSSRVAATDQLSSFRAHYQINPRGYTYSSRRASLTRD